MFAEIHKMFTENLSLKNARNLSSKNIQIVFLNTQNLSLIMHKMFSELHQMFFEMHKIFPKIIPKMFAEIHKMFAEMHKMFAEMHKTFPSSSPDL